jgi:hypothetical protein
MPTHISIDLDTLSGEQLLSLARTNLLPLRDVAASVLRNAGMTDDEVMWLLTPGAKRRAVNATTNSAPAPILNEVAHENGQVETPSARAGRVDLTTGVIGESTVDDFRAAWGDSSFTNSDIRNYFGIGENTMRDVAQQLGLGPRPRGRRTKKRNDG